MYLFIILSSAAFFFYRAGGAGTYSTLWAFWPITMLLLPSWIRAQFGGIGLDFRGVVAAAIALSLALGKNQGSRGRIVLLDALVVLIALAHAVSIITNDTIRPTLIPTIALIYLPYAIGRRYLTSAADLRRATGPMAAAVLALAALAAFESVTRVNPLCRLTGMRFPPYVRMGLMRAYGSAQHPIALGSVLVLGLPWVLVAARRARDEGGQAWLRRGPWLFAAGMVGTLSRGPILAAIGAKLVDVFFRRPFLRVPLLALAVGAAAFAAFGREAVVSALSEVSGESHTHPDDERIVIINGKEYLYSGTRHRILQFEVYSERMASAGLFGYGAGVGGAGLDEELGDRFWSIDNHYIILIVGQGYVGFALFIAVTLVTLVNFGRTALSRRSGFELAGAYFGAVLCVALNLLTVWLDPTLKVAYLFAAGLSANLQTLSEDDPGSESDLPDGPEDDPVPASYPGDYSPPA